MMLYFITRFRPHPVPARRTDRRSPPFPRCPDVTKNPVWGPAIQARQETENVAKFANEQLQRSEQAIRKAGATPDQIKQ